MAWRPQGTGKPGDMICLCIGGRLFITRRATLYRLPDSRLYLIATQGASSQPTTTNFAPSFNSTADLIKPTDRAPSPSPSHDTRVVNANMLESSTVGGATILSGGFASMLAGNMNLKSASTLCRNRGSMAPVTPSSTQELNCSMNLSVQSHLSNTIDLNTTMFQQSTPVVYFYDRDPEIFRFVLDYYRTGELHLPSSICGPFVRKELIFWGIDESLIGPCCMPAYMRYDEEKRTKNTLFRDCFEDIESMQNLVEFSRGWKKWRYRMWLFMDHPSSSLPAKIWASCLLVLMIASVMCFCLSTHDNFRMQSSLLKSTQSLTKHKFPLSTTPDVTPSYAKRYSRLNSAPTPATGTDEDEDSVPLIRFCKDSFTSPNPKLHRDCFTEPSKGLVMTDIALNCLFSAEFMLKVLLAPDKPRFLSSVVSIFDITILSSYWVYMALFYIYYYRPKSWSVVNDEFEFPSSGALWLMNILFMTQVMRILRIFKISKISRILRVLILTVKKSIPELVLLGFLLMNGMFLFSSLMYTAEYYVNDTFPNIPQSFWWSIITLTAVGYGDMHPKGGAGYFVGSVTAICGCIVTGLAIPIIGNNFNTYYKYMKNQLMEDKYLKTLQKDMGGTLPKGKTGIGTAAEKTGLSLPGRKLRKLNRRAVRERVQDRTFKQKLVQLFHVNGDSFKRYLPRRYGSKKYRSGFTNANTSNKTPSIQLFSESQHGLNSLNVNSITAFKPSIQADNPSSEGRKMTNYTLDGMEREQRTSLTYPLATDNLLNSLTPSRLSLLHTPEIWVGDDYGNELFMNPIDLFCKQNANNSLRCDTAVTKVNPIQSNTTFPPRSSHSCSFGDPTTQCVVNGTTNLLNLYERNVDSDGAIFDPTQVHSDGQFLLEKRKNYV